MKLLYELIEDDDDEQKILSRIKSEIHDPYRQHPLPPKAIEYLLNKVQEKNEEIERLENRLANSAGEGTDG